MYVIVSLKITYGHKPVKRRTLNYKWTSVLLVVCIDLSGKGPHSQVGVDRVIT